MRVVACLSLKNLNPRVWDPESPYHLPALKAVMVSYAELQGSASRRRRAMEQGLCTFLGLPETVEAYLDNGAFYFSLRGQTTDPRAYRAFVAQARPDWKPVAQDFIPSPDMTLEEQRECLRRTMAVNRDHGGNGFVPVIHVSRVLPEYVEALLESGTLTARPWLALGAIVPNLLRAPKAMPYGEILSALREVRRTFAEQQLHVFGMGGTATLHLAALLGIDSLDSSGWRNRAARGIVQLPGSGDRTVASLGSWRGRQPSDEEWRQLEACGCPACRRMGLEGLRAGGQPGFCHRATHNLYVLLEEARWIREQLGAGTYLQRYQGRLRNTIYLPLVRQAAEVLAAS